MPDQPGIVDLSVTLETGGTVYPGDPPLVIEPALRLSAGDGVNVLALHMGSHSGTHVDAPYHLIEGGARIDELPLGLFVGPAVVADLRYVPAAQPITWADLEAVQGRLGPGTMLLLHTGWSRHWADPARCRAHPWLTREAAAAIVSAGVRTVAIDALSVDATPEDLAGTSFEAHLAILGAGGVIVENLTRLEAVARMHDPIVSVLPLKIARADGAPVRAVAYERSAWSPARSPA